MKLIMTKTPGSNNEYIANYTGETGTGEMVTDEEAHHIMGDDMFEIIYNALFIWGATLDDTNQIEIKTGEVMKNILHNIKDGEHWGGSYPNLSGYDLARVLAQENQEKTGNVTVVTRIVDYVDRYEGNDREHFSFDVTEIIQC